MPATICTKCVHFFNLEPNSPRSHTWYNHLCCASPLPKAVDPFDGQEKPYRTNDIVRQYFVDKEFEYCREINNGNCPKFTAKEQKATLH